MDFAAFDQRGRDEAGRAFPILHPETGDEIPGARFVIRGTSSPTVQAAERQCAQAAMLADEKRPLTMGTAHDEMVQIAAPYIIGFEGVERDGRPATAADAEWFLNLTFPRMARDDNGELKTANHPFASQVLRRAGEVSATLGNAPAP